jgi:hypothetical protein
MNIKRGSAFALVGCGKSGLMKKDRKGYKTRTDRRLEKVRLKMIG